MVIVFGGSAANDRFDLFEPITVSKGVNSYNIHIKLMADKPLNNTNYGVNIKNVRLKVIKFEDDQTIIAGSTKAPSKMLR